MRHLATALCLVILAAQHGTQAAPAKKEKEDPVAAELAKLAGTWKVVGFVDDGEADDEDDLKRHPLITFKGKDYTWGEEDVPSGKIDRLDPTKKPKEIDYVARKGGEEGEKELAIYELDGDTFRDCISLDGKTRPTKFEAKEGSKHLLVTYKRVKPKDD